VLNLLIGISQRVVISESSNERRDALDQSWIPFLLACNIEPVLVPNSHPDPVDYLCKVGVHGLILTGGGNISDSLGTLNKKPANIPDYTCELSPERDKTETALLFASIRNHWPVIGVCRGMQVLNLFHGGSIVTVKDHVAIKHSLERKEHSHDAKVFKLDSQVNSFHDYGFRMTELGKDLEVIATSGEVIEAFIHRKIGHMGIMWHPERNQPFSSNDINLFKSVFDS
jgi:N5-(cytidine 5'-diphosphoramidyl)-L-glutamine hydrolase